MCMTNSDRTRDATFKAMYTDQQPFAFPTGSDLLILDYEQRKSHLKKLGQKLEEMRSKHHRLLLQQVSTALPPNKIARKAQGTRPHRSQVNIVSRLFGWSGPNHDDLGL